MLMKAVDDKDAVPRGQFDKHFKALQEKADDLTALAQERLAELEKPIG
jgi:hypothetical protein